jgi:hypothetical protein
MAARSSRNNAHFMEIPRDRDGLLKWVTLVEEEADSGAVGFYGKRLGGRNVDNGRMW